MINKHIAIKCVLFDMLLFGSYCQRAQNRHFVRPLDQCIYLACIGPGYADKKHSYRHPNRLNFGREHRKNQLFDQ